MTDHLQRLALRGAGLPPARGASLLMPRQRSRFESAPPGEMPGGLEIEEREVTAGSAAPGFQEEADRSSNRESRRRQAETPRVMAMPLQCRPEPSERGRRTEARPGEKDGTTATAAQASATERGGCSEKLAPTPAESSPRPPRVGGAAHVEAARADTTVDGTEPSSAARPASERSRATRGVGLRPLPQRSTHQDPDEAATEDASAAAEPAPADPAVPPTKLSPPRPALLEPAPPAAAPGPREAAPWRGEPAHTTVHVTIGRIEVEVAPPAAPPPVRARPEPRRGFAGYGPARRGRLR